MCCYVRTRFVLPHVIITLQELESMNNFQSTLAYLMVTRESVVRLWYFQAAPNIEAIDTKKIKRPIS